jgi:hypothetical protein
LIEAVPYKIHTVLDNGIQSTFPSRYADGRTAQYEKRYRASPYQGEAPICKQWAIQPKRFRLNPIHQMPGLNTYCRLAKVARCCDRENNGRYGNPTSQAVDCKLVTPKGTTNCGSQDPWGTSRGPPAGSEPGCCPAASCNQADRLMLFNEKE